MSSPLSVLKKTKRTPLQQWNKQDMQPRRNLMREFQAAAADNGSSISDLNLPVTSNIQLNDTAKTSEKKGSTPSTELMSDMTQRLSRLEERVRVQAQEIQCKDIRISALEEELRVKKETASEMRSRDDLERRFLQLQSQVYEMESFLIDYGLIWVGSRDLSEKDQSEQTYSSDRLWRPSENSVDRWFHMNFDLILEKIQELNILAGEGETYIQTTATGAQLAQKKPVQLRLYRNGIVMFDGPFRSYQEQKTQQFMQDLMDGYFPSELQERFPDGVPFEVHDRRDEEFIPRQQRKTFPGYGQVIRGDDEKKSNLLNTVPGKKLGQPKVAVKAGQVINIREITWSALQGSSDAHNSHSVILVDTPALQEIKERLQSLKPECPVSDRDVTTLKIRSEDGSQTYILKMSFSETIGQLRQHLDKHRGDNLASYDIISAYPQCCYDDNSQTIRSCGLTANAALLLRKRPPIN